MINFSKVNTIMYHYVRPIQNSEYPNIKGLELEGFRRQLDFFCRNYSIVKAEDVIEASINASKLPDKSIWLTFDDGFKDHIDFVLPELKKRGLQGTFFPVEKPTRKKQYLDVHAIHFILESAESSDSLINSLRTRCLEHGMSELRFKELWDDVDKSSPYDSQSVIFFKRILQRELPLEIRGLIVRSLFQEFVNKSESEFCEELYMTENDLRKLLSEGMFIGSHTSNHFWLDSMDLKGQRLEISKSLEFLSNIGANTDNWIMCYPYGAYNSDTLDILEDLDCRIGLTTQTGEARIGLDNSLLLPRFDTNNFPQ